MIHGLLDWLAFGFVRLTGGLVQGLPLQAALLIGQSLGRAAYYFAPKRAGVAYVNFKSAFPQTSVRQRRHWIREMFSNLGMNGVEILRFPILTREDVEKYVTHHGYETYLEHRWQGKGLILVTAHVGNWELSQMIEAVRQRPVSVLIRKQKYRRLDGFLNSLRQCRGAVSLGKADGIRDLIRCLQGGGTAGILADQSGGEEGVWVRFFGRLTTAPRGPMALALKRGFNVMPVFMLRRRGPFHDIFFEPPFELVRTGDYERDVQVNTQNYISLLESYLTRYPAQWLWGHKRWKRTRTKRILILSDGKPGHVKQSESLVKEMIESGRRADARYEMPVEKIEIQFRSAWHKRIFYLFAFFFIPWAQGRLAWLRLFLTQASAGKLERATPDLIISAGALMAPLNLCLARENLAKSVVLMKPSFPFNLFRYDLALVPTHDRGLMPAGHFRIQGSLSGVGREDLVTAGKLLARSIPHPEKVRFAIFLGGETRDFTISRADVENLIAQVERAARSSENDFLVTTSRRTPENISRLLEDKLKTNPHCAFFCNAHQDRRPEVVPGMMALAEVLIITEDSLSMISEALSSGKKVVVVKMGQNHLPSKHHRFQETLRTEWGVPVVKLEELYQVIGQGEIPAPREHWEEEREKIREKVEDLL